MKKIFSNAFDKESIVITKRYSPDSFVYLSDEGMGLTRVKLPELKSMTVKLIADPNYEGGELFVDGGADKGIGIGHIVGVESERFNKYFDVGEEGLTSIVKWLGVTDTIKYQDAKKAIENFRAKR